MKEIKKSILLVDDNEYTLDLLEIFLYKQYEILTAQNGFDGYNIAMEKVPACIITDVMMPVMDGIKFISNLKKREKTSLIPVIAVTSFIKKISRRSLLNIGFRDVVLKPLKRNTVVNAVKNVIESDYSNVKKGD